MNKSLRIGIRTGLSFGLAMGVFAYFRTGRPIPALINMGSGIFFGAGMAWFSSLGERRLKARGIEATDLNPVQIRTVSYPGSQMEALEVARQALQTLRKVKKIAEVPTPLSLRAKTGFTFEGFGENVVVELSPSDTGTDMQISSKPRISTTEMDMGKGVENVETIVKFLVGKGALRRVA